jgi:DNA (cytosine-5)-methyltransferase 1
VPWFEAYFGPSDEGYVRFAKLNSADYGVPQTRERVILAAGVEPVRFPPLQTHSSDALSNALRDGSYHRRHGIPIVADTGPDVGLDELDLVANPVRLPRSGRIVARADQVGKPVGEPWLTVRDALATIPATPQSVADRLALTPAQIERTRLFRGIPESDAGAIALDLDAPCGTVTTRRGGHKTNDALILPHGGGFRYTTVAEVAAFQSFPPDHPWQGGEAATYKQVGNAVPPPLAEALGRALLGS